ncbi:hypothetical protein EDD16DRAFT_1008625 [Pisolithus croceorrhizus]|nr:hypothetical protein EDD16DRAFT_1008625 [Pisolithus croceorrhizus]
MPLVTHRWDSSVNVEGREPERSGCLLTGASNGTTAPSVCDVSGIFMEDANPPCLFDCTLIYDGVYFGVRLVRGEYRLHMTASHVGSLSTVSVSVDLGPLSSSKLETDTRYVASSRRFIWDTQSGIFRVGSSGSGQGEIGARSRRENGPRTSVVPREVAERCAIVQLYSVANTSTSHVAAHITSPIPCVTKCCHTACSTRVYRVPRNLPQCSEASHLSSKRSALPS